MTTVNTKYKSVWDGVVLFSFVLSIIIVLQHNTAVNYYDLQIEGNAATVVIIDLISKFIVPIAVPGFMIQSAILFYRNYDISKTVKKWKTRIRSLLIPYLLWNILYTVIMAVISYYPPLAALINSREMFEMSVGNLLGGVFFYKYNGVFWYIFDLIVFTVLAPFIYQLIKNKKIGICAVVVIGCLYCIGFKYPKVVFRHDAVFYYVLGAYIGTHYWDKIENAKLSTCSVAVACVTGLVMYITCNALSVIRHLTQVVYILTGVSLIWRLILNKVNITIKPWMKMSFVIYSMHWLILSAVVKIFAKLTDTVPMGLALNYIGSTMVTLLVIVTITSIWKKIFPGCYAVFSGQR